MLALVVDDSRAMRSILTRLLSGLGFDVAQAGDGAEALSVLDAGTRPDVILVDWNMPVMDGLTFIKNVRALAAGAHEYVIKPFTDEVIAEKLALLGLVA